MHHGQPRCVTELERIPHGPTAPTHLTLTFFAGYPHWPSVKGGWAFGSTEAYRRTATQLLVDCVAAGGFVWKSAGSGRTQVAKVIGNMLSSHDNTRTRASKLLMPSRQEVFHPHSMSRTQELLEKVWARCNIECQCVKEELRCAPQRTRFQGGWSRWIVR